MSTHPVKRIFNLIGRRTVVLYGLIFVVSLFAVDYSTVKQRFKITILNRIRPSYMYLVELIDGEWSIDEMKLKHEVRYFRSVVDLIPQRPDAWGILGFCEYYLGHEEEAVQAFEKAIEIVPQYFWYHYNLGLIHFKSGRYQKAVAGLTAAIKQKPNHVLKVIEASKIYRPIVAVTNIASDDKLIGRIQEGNVQAYILIIESFRRLGNYKQAIVYAKQAIGSSAGDNYFFNYMLAQISEDVKDYKNAIIFYKESIRLNSLFADGYLGLGRVLSKAGSSLLAEKITEQGNKLMKKDLDTKFNIDDYKLYIF